MNNWYKSSRESVKRVYGQDWKLFLGLLACTSAHSSVKANVTLAKKAYNQIKNNQELSGYLPAHIINMHALLSTGMPNGRKIKSFYRNLIGDETCVTVDMWMMRYYGYSKDIPTTKQYDIIEKQVQSEAITLGLTSAQHQANIWKSIRGQGESFGDLVNQYRLL